MNINFLKKDNSKELKSIISSYNYKQLIDSATRITNNTSTLIDVILTNISKNIKNVITTPLSLSDHDLIGCVRKLNNHNTKSRTRTSRNYSKYNPDNMKTDLSREVFEPLFHINNVNKDWLILCNILTNCFENHAPVITKRVKGTFAPWLNSEIKKLMSNRDKMLRKFRKTNDNNHWDEYKRLRNSCTAKLRNAKSDHHQSL